MKTFTILLSFFSAITTFAGIDVLDRKVQTFTNHQCDQNESCDLVSAKLEVQNWRIWIEGQYSYGTRMAASYQTREVTDLENYVYVNFIRGGQFTSCRSDRSTHLMKFFSQSITSFGEKKAYHHPDWTVDSVDKDPAYFSTQDFKDPLPRHALYYWKSNRSSLFSEDGQHHYGNKKPTTPMLYVTDRPGTAFRTSYRKPDGENLDCGINISLEYKTCLYKASEVPTLSSEDQIHFAEPLHCFEWKSSFIFNHEKVAFEIKDELDPFVR